MQPAQPLLYLPSLNLLEADYNPRLLTDKDAYHLTESLLLFGFVDALVVNQHPSRSHVIVGGHQRRRIANKVYQEGVAPFYFVNSDGTQRTYPANHPLEGQDMIHPRGYVVSGCGLTDAGGLAMPCWPVALELERERELNVRLNLNSGRWDFEVLANRFDTDFLLGVGFEPYQLGIDNAFETAPDRTENSSPSEDTTEGGEEAPEYAPYIRIEFGNAGDLQAVQNEIQEILDRVLAESDYQPMLQINLGSAGGDLAEAA